MPSTKPLKSERVALGRRLGKARKARGLSKAEAARQIGVRVQSWQQWERGVTSPRREKLPELAQLLGVDVAELFEEPRAMRAARLAEAVERFSALPAALAEAEEAERSHRLALMHAFEQLSPEMRAHVLAVVTMLAASVQAEIPALPLALRRRHKDVA